MSRKPAILTSRIGRRLLYRVLLFSGGLAILFTAAQLYIDYVRDLNALEQTVAVVEQSHKRAVVDAVWDVDRARVQTTLDAIVAQPLIRGARVDFGGGADGAISAGVLGDDDPIRRQVELVFAAGDRRLALGQLTVIGDIDAVQQRSLDRVFVVLASQSLKTLLVAIFILVVAHQLFGRRLQRAQVWLAEYSTHKPFEPLKLSLGPVDQFDELDALGARISAVGAYAHAYANTLESEVAEQTAELRARNEALDDAVKAERELHAQLSREAEIRSRFFGILAHDMRNQLQPILGGSDLLADTLHSMTTEEIQRRADTIRRSAHALNRLLDSILEWTRLQMDLDEARPRVISARDLCLECVADVATAAEAKDIRIDIAVDGQSVMADPDMSRGVLRNLLTNAVKFSPVGAGVRIASSVDNGRVEIAVEDQGVGVPSADIEALFGGTDRRPRRGTAGEQGSGLGLPLSAELARRQGGSIGYRPREGGGSVFWVLLPVAEVSAQP